MANIAWSSIHTRNKGGELKVIQPGESVTADQVGGKEALDELIEAGAVRDKKYPKTNEYESPREHNLRQLNEKLQEASDNAYSDLDFLEPNEMEPPVALS